MLFFIVCKILDWLELKVFADNILKVAETPEFVLDLVESIVGKCKSADYQHFLLFAYCFHKVAFLGLLKLKFGCNV